MASKHSVYLEGKETISGAADKASGSIRRLHMSMKDTTSGAKDLMGALKGFAAFGGATALLSGFVRGLKDCETAFVKLHPEMKEAAGSAEKFKTSIESLKAALGGTIVAAISPFRSGMTEVVSSLAEAIQKTNDLRTALVMLQVSQSPAAKKYLDQITGAQAQIDELRRQRETAIRPMMTDTASLIGGAWAASGNSASAANPVTRLNQATAEWDKQLKSSQENLDKLVASALAALNPEKAKGGKGGAGGGAWDWWKTQTFLNVGKFGEGFGQTPKMEESGAALWDGFIGSMEGYGKLPIMETASEKDWFMEQRAGALGAASAARNPIEQISPLMEVLSLLGEQFQSVSILMQPFQIILNSAMEVLRPVVDTVLAPLVGIFAILGNTLGQILVPIVQALTPVIEAVGTGFVWLYNEVIKPVGNFLWATFTNLGAAISNFVTFIGYLFTHPIWEWGNAGNRSNRVDYVTPGQGPLANIDTGTLGSAGMDYMNGQSGYGTGASSSTTVQKPADVYIYFTIQGNVVGEGGKAEVGKWLIDTIQQALDVGVRPKFLENN